MKYIIFILFSINIIAFRPLLAKNSLEYNKNFKDTRIYYENQMYQRALKDKLKDSNLNKIEEVYLLKEIEKSNNRVKNLNILPFETLIFINDIEKSLYRDLLEHKKITRNNSTYKFYKNLILDNLTFLKKFPKMPNQIKKFEGKNEILGDNLDGNLIITFDDGPSKYTPIITKILKENNISAIFFILADRIDTYKEDIKNMINDGYVIGVHSNTHPNLINLEDKEVEVEVSHGQKKLLKDFSYKVRYFRSPYGSRKEDTLDIINKYYQNHILWNIDSVDWHKGFTKEIIIERVTRLSYLYNGGIILFHDINNKSPYVIDEIIKNLKDGGFEFKNQI